MLTTKSKIAIVILAASILLAAVIYVCKIANTVYVVEAVDVRDDSCSTSDALVVYEQYDTLMIGKWQHAIDTTWYRVYTSEPTGDGYYWGKEWDTSDDVYEEDLTTYGNGWFKWKKTGKAILELHMTDLKGAIVPYEYNVLKLDVKQLYLKENLSSEKHLFRKI